MKRQRTPSHPISGTLGLIFCTCLFLAGCGGGGGGGGGTSNPSGSEQKAQSIAFGDTPTLTNQGTATVSATASSGMPVSYSSLTPAICSINGSTGVVTALAAGTCTIAASQTGNSEYAAAAQTTINISIPGSQQQAQTITFGAAPALSQGGTATVTATASSGLPVTFSSTTPAICSINSSSGAVTDITNGTCVIAADQAGNAEYSAAPQVTQSITVARDRTQTITFGTAPALKVGSTAPATATASSGLAVTYGSSTPAVCSVNASTGAVTGIAVGNCTIVANQAGNTDYDAATQATLTFAVAAAPVQAKAPDAPAGVKAELGSAANTVVVSFGYPNNGGSTITGYAVTSSPAGIAASGGASPITVTCPTTCAGYGFSVYAINSVGNGAASAAVDVITDYNVVETFYEPATQPNNSIFTGSFTVNSTKGTVSGLQGNLTESMTTDSSDPNCASTSGCPGGYGKVPMTLVPLTHQLSSIAATIDGVSGLLVTSFTLSTTDTFYKGAGTVADPYNDGWTPQVGADVGGIYFGWPSALNPYKGGVGNAYAMIFVNPANPAATLTSAQINKLAYADCTKGGMMGAVCMTGTTVAGYGAAGTMGGYPVSQVVTKK